MPASPRPRWSGLLLLLLLPLAAQAASWERVSPDTLKLSGEIDESSLAEYTAVAKSGYRHLLLDSPGGLPGVALAIAEDVMARQADVTVTGNCLSACANYLAIAGRRLHVGCDALLGWHGSTLAPLSEDEIADLRRQGAPDEFIRRYADWHRAFDERERRFYRHAGIDRAILQDSVAVMAQQNVAPETRVSFDFDELTGALRTASTSTAALWLPPADVLVHYGFPARDFDACYTAGHIAQLVRQRGYHFAYTSKALEK